MNKLIKKVVGACLGLTMAIGVGVAITHHGKKISSVEAADENVSFTVGPNAASIKVNWNGSGAPSKNNGVRIGTSSSVGSATFKIPAGTTKFGIYAVGWSGKATTARVDTSLGTISTNTASLTSNAAASGTINTNATVAITETEANAKKEFTISGVTAEATITLTTSGSNKRLIAWDAYYVSEATYVVDKLLLNNSESFSSLTIDGNNEATSKQASLTYQVTYTGTAGEGKVNTTVKDSDGNDTNKLTVANDGKGTLTLTAKQNGTYTLTVSTKDEDASSSVVSRDVTVTVQNLLTPVYPTKQTSTEGLSIADKIYFVNETGNKAAGPIGSSNDTSYLSAVSVSLEDGSMTEKNTALEFTLGRNGEHYTFETSSGLLGFGASKASISLEGDGTTTFALSFSSGNVVISSSINSSNQLLYNSSSPRFANYLSSMAAIQLYVLHASDEEVAAEFENNYLVMGSNVDGQCNTYYANAKTTFATLTDGQKAKLSAAALQRLHDWAAAKGDNFSIENKAFAANNKIVSLSSFVKGASTETSILLIVSLLSLTALGGYFLLRKKKEQQ